MKSESDLLKKKKLKKKKDDEMEYDPESDFPVHEKYTKQGPWKEG